MKNQNPTTPQRQHQRSPANTVFRVYSSLAAGSQLIKVLNISKSGAFLSSPIIPHLYETITCKIIDEKWTELWSINARVVRVNDKNYVGPIGFGVEFQKPLTDDQEIQIKSLQTAQPPVDNGPSGNLWRRYRR